MKRQLFALLTLTTLAGCDTHKSTSTETTLTDSTATTMSAGEPQCYALMMNGDTVRLSLTRTGNDVAGELFYQLSGKDRNTGTLSGRMKGDTLLADYNFKSEGVASVREVAFLAKDDGFIEGYGSVQEQNGKMQFTPNKHLTFGTDRVLTKTPCAK